MDIMFQVLLSIAISFGILWFFSWSFKRTVRRWNRRVEEFFEIAPFKISAIILALFIYFISSDSIEKIVLLTIISIAFTMKVILDLGNWINDEIKKGEVVAIRIQKTKEKELYEKEMLNFFLGKNVEIDDIRGF